MEHGVKDQLEVADRIWEVSRQLDRGQATRPSDLGLGGVTEVVQDSIGLVGVRNATHRVWKVPIEAGEEPEPVFSGKTVSTGRARMRNGKAARLSAWQVAALQDRHGETSLGELLRRRHAADATTEDQD
jgi:hypothetical protein